MKKAFLAFTIVLMVGIAAAIAFSGSLVSTREDVTVSAETLFGDPSEAAGLTAAQSLHYDHTLLWDLSIPLDSPESTAVDFSKNPLKDSQPLKEADWRDPTPTFSLTPAFAFFYVFDVGEDLDRYYDTDPWLIPIADAAREVVARTPDGETYTETRPMADYLDAWPLALEGSTYRADTDAIPALHDADQFGDLWLTDYFSLPVPQEATLTFTAEKNASGLLLDLQVESDLLPLFPDVHWLDTGEDLYFAFDQHWHTDFSRSADGYGVYRMDVSEARQDLWPFKYMDPTSIENLCPLPEGAVVLDLNTTPDGSALLVTYHHNDEYTCLVFDLSAGTVRQQFTIPADAPSPGFVSSWTADGTYLGEVPTLDYTITTTLAADTCLLFFREGAGNLFYLYEPTGRGYSPVFTGPVQTHFRDPNDHYDHLTALWTGHRLAVASVPMIHDQSTGLVLSIFRDGNLTYQADYSTSLDNTLQSPPEAPSFRIAVRTVDGSELTLQ